MTETEMVYYLGSGNKETSLIAIAEGKEKRHTGETCDGMLYLKRRLIVKEEDGETRETIKKNKFPTR